MALPRVSVLAVVTVALLSAPLVLAEDARPVHRWLGSGDARVHVDGPVVSPLSLSADVKGLCADVEPVLTGDGLSVDPSGPGVTAPLPMRDGARETGVGGACFAFGEDANKTMRVTFQELVSSGTSLRALVCVDVDGDGSCGAPADHVDLCRLSSEQPVSVWTGQPCQIYADPAAADPTIYFLALLSLETDTSPVVSRGVAGYAFVYPAY